MPCRIYLRCGQSINLREAHSSKAVSIFAPLWVKDALVKLGEHLKGITFDVYDNCSRLSNSAHEPVESFTISEDFNNQSLKVLQKIARNESHNTSGVINKTLYSDIKDKRVLYSIRDLVRQCVIAGSDEATACGGYGCQKEHQKTQRVYVCDLAALQFQQPYNTGRLILVQAKEEYEGILDDFIYERVVGETRKSYEEVSNGWNSDKAMRDRYVPHDGFGFRGKCFIDTYAYRKFVALDVVLSATALSEVASLHGDKVNFKFLKYGTGFFAATFGTELNKLILSGVVDGLENLFRRNDAKVSVSIKRIELPFYKSDPMSSKRIENLEKEYGVKVHFSSVDALKQTCEATVLKKGLLTATTNCGDNHAACGNEMNYGSVDAAISENLTSKGNLFSPNINILMTEKFVEV